MENCSGHLLPIIRGPPPDIIAQVEWYEFDLTNVVPVNYLKPRRKMLDSTDERFRI